MPLITQNLSSFIFKLLQPACAIMPVRTLLHTCRHSNNRARGLGHGMPFLPAGSSGYGVVDLTLAEAAAWSASGKQVVVPHLATGPC